MIHLLKDPWRVESIISSDDNAMSGITLRKKLKRWLYGSCPGFAGAFPYFGARVYFPKRSVLFEAACAQGIYEQTNLHAMLEFVRDGSLVIDVGANIGLMAVPVLASKVDVKVLSFEASPETLRFVLRTRDESAFRGRWEIVAKAAGSVSGTAKFSVGPPALGALDGFRNTGRVAGQTQIDVEVTTIDVEWRQRGCPDVSVIKIDVEGAEYDVLLGARECLSRWRPAIVMEWSLKNIGAYGRKLGDLLELAKQLGYRVWALPGRTEVHDAMGLRVQASVTESFLLVAASAGKSG